MRLSAPFSFAADILSDRPSVISGGEEHDLSISLHVRIFHLHCARPFVETSGSTGIYGVLA